MLLNIIFETSRSFTLIILKHINGYLAAIVSENDLKHVGI